MSLATLSLGRTFLLRVLYDSDLIEFITEQAKKHQISLAAFTAVGAVKSAKLGFYDQTNHEYLPNLLDYPQEIASCIGNISLKEGAPFVHAHAVLADESGNTKGGHLFECKVFAAEVHVTELLGQKFEREKDVQTGLSLWEM
jgi:hypothetical protein